MKFAKNLSPLDRSVRGVIGVILVAVGLFFGESIGDPLLQTLVIVFGLLNLISLLSGWCMVYQLASISTLKKN